MEQHPKISIVTPSYNQGKYIEQTILSVIEQNYPNLEFIIIDGASTDNTIEIIRKYEKYISFWVSEKDLGQTDAINKGFSRCTGDLFNWINSDDYYEPGALFRIAQCFTSNPNVDVVCGKEYGFYDNKINGRILHPGSVIKGNVYDTIQAGIIDQPCTFFRRNSIETFFPLNINLKYLMDRQLWWCYLMRYGQDKVLKSDEIFTNFRIHEASKSVKDADSFEVEFDMLKLTLFESLDAPSFLIKQLRPDVPSLQINFPNGTLAGKKILAAFASEYALRNYVKDRLEEAKHLIQFVAKIRGFYMSGIDFKLWFLTVVMPFRLLLALKRLKSFF